MPQLELMLHVTDTALCGFGWAMIAYSGFATPRGCRVGASYFADFSWLQGIAYLALFGSLIFGFLAVGWWRPTAMLLAGNILSRRLLPVAEESTQTIVPVAVLLLGIACLAVWLAQ